MKIALELLGALAIAASLVFVGMQLQQDRRIAQAERYSDRTQNFSENIRLDLAHHDMTAIQFKARAGEELTEVEEEAYLSRLFLAHIAYANIYYRHRLDLLDEDVWNATRSVIKRNLRESRFAKASVFPDHAYKALIEDLKREIANEPSATAPHN